MRFSEMNDSVGALLPGVVTVVVPPADATTPVWSDVAVAVAAAQVVCRHRNTQRRAHIGQADTVGAGCCAVDIGADRTRGARLPLIRVTT